MGKIQNIASKGFENVEFLVLPVGTDMSSCLNATGAAVISAKETVLKGTVMIVGGVVGFLMNDVKTDTNKKSTVIAHLIYKSTRCICPKDSNAITIGQKVYWNNNVNSENVSADGLDEYTDKVGCVGFCTKAALASDTEVEVYFVGFNGALTPDIITTYDA
jgi:hypothetical protein